MSDKLREIFFGQYDPLARAAPQGEEFDRVFDELEDYYKECIGLIKENKARLYGKAGARTEEE